MGVIDLEYLTRHYDDVPQAKFFVIVLTEAVNDIVSY